MRLGESPTYRFGAFTLNTSQHLLLKGSLQVYLRPRTFQTLLYLVEHAGKLIPKDELLDAVWADAVVTENTLSQCIKELRQALEDEVSNPRYIKTVPRVGFEFIAPVEVLPDESTEDTGESTSHPPPPATSGNGKDFLKKGAGLFAALLVLFFLLYLLFTGQSGLTFSARDWVLVTDFTNYTDAPVFSAALHTALEYELSRSRYVNIVPPVRVGDVLKRMRKTPLVKIDETLAREICLRDGNIRAILSGSIEEIGGKYALTVKLINPKNGVTVKSFTEFAGNQGEVLPVIRKLARQVRESLGESLLDIHKTEQQLEKVTTPSLKALELYSRAVVFAYHSDWEKARVLLEQAVAEDSTFAIAYNLLGFTYQWLGRLAKSRENFRRAARLSNRVSDREKYFILGSYYAFGLGDYSKGRDYYEVLLQLYPDDYWGHENLSLIYLYSGDFQRAQEHKRARARLRPLQFTNYSDIGVEALFAGDVEKAHQYLTHALKLNPDIGFDLPHLSRFFLAWMQNDFARATAEIDTFREQRLNKLLPDFQATARQFLARYYFFTGETERGISNLQEALAQARQRSPHIAPWVQLELALAEKERGNHATFKRVMTEVAQQSVGVARVRALGWLAMDAAEKGDTLHARQLLKELQQEERLGPVTVILPPVPVELEKSKQAYTAFIEGQIALTRGDMKEAIRRFREVTSLVPMAQLAILNTTTPRLRVKAFLALAKIYEQQGNQEAAITAYQNILDEKALMITVPGVSTLWVQALSNVSHVLEKNGKPEKAATYRKLYRQLRGR